MTVGVGACGVAGVQNSFVFSSVSKSSSRHVHYTTPHEKFFYSRMTGFAFSKDKCLLIFYFRPKLETSENTLPVT